MKIFNAVIFFLLYFFLALFISPAIAIECPGVQQHISGAATYNLDCCNHSTFEDNSDDKTIINNLVKCIETIRDKIDKDKNEDDKNKLIHLEHVLRKKGETICDSLANYQKLLDNPNIINDTDNRKKTEEKVKEYKKYIEKIRRTISFSGCNALFQSFDDYDQFFFRLNIGYEYAAVDTMFKQGTPRIGLMVYSRHWEYKSTDGESGLGFYGVHHSFTAQLTGSGEQETTQANIGSQNNISIRNLGDKRSLEFEMPFFIPIYRTERLNFGRLWGYIGPVLVVGGKKLDESKQAILRRYAGIRFANNPELYADIMYGFTEGIGSQRLEARGQLPISWFFRESFKDSRIFLGAIGNFGIGDRRDNEADVIRAYLSWNVDFLDIFNSSPQK